MEELISNMLRKRSRTALTIFGIFIGIFAFTVMGALAEKINKMVSNGEKYFEGQITVNAAFSGTPMGGFFPVEKLSEIKKVPGVEEVFAQVMMMMDETQGIYVGVPSIIYGTDLNHMTSVSKHSNLVLGEGRLLKPGERGKVIVGCDLARERRLSLGSKLAIKGRVFEVVGIAEKTMTGPDKMAAMALTDAQELLVDSQPYLRSLKERVAQIATVPAFLLALLPAEFRDQLEVWQRLTQNDLATSAAVRWRAGEDPEKVAARIRSSVREVEVMSPREMIKSLRQATAVLNLIVLGSALVALAVGSLSVINTMTMAVTERVREIGLKKALGARFSDIMAEFLTEAGCIGLVGGVLGTGAGWGFVSMLNLVTRARGAEVFLVTPRLALGAIILATGLGVLSGIYPAARAAGLDCVRALREE